MNVLNLAKLWNKKINFPSKTAAMMCLMPKKPLKYVGGELAPQALHCIFVLHFSILCL